MTAATLQAAADKSGNPSHVMLIVLVCLIVGAALLVYFSRRRRTDRPPADKRSDTGQTDEAWPPAQSTTDEPSQTFPLYPKDDNS